MQLMLPVRSSPEGRLVLGQGKMAGRPYRVEPQICCNSVCQCQGLTLHCPETPADKIPFDTPVAQI